MAKPKNRDVREYVQNRREFTTKNGTMFARWERDDTYIVYSYGHHFPMYIYDKALDLWFGNDDMYSVTTGKHKNQARPDGDIIWLPSEQLKRLRRPDGTRVVI